MTFDIEFKGRSAEVIALVSLSLTEEVLLSWQILKKLGAIPDGGLPFGVDVWRDVACTQSLISADQILPVEVPNDVDPKRQKEQIPMLERTLAMQQVSRTENVRPCLVDMDGRFLPTSMETGIYLFQNLASNHWNKSIPEICTVGTRGWAFNGEFWRIMDSGWWKQDVNKNIPHFVHVFMVDGRGFDKKSVD